MEHGWRLLDYVNKILARYQDNILMKKPNNAKGLLSQQNL